MPPKQSSTGAGRGRPAKTNKTQPPARDASESSNPFESSDDQAGGEADGSTSQQAIDVEEERAEPEKSIPNALLTRILHEFFAKEATRMSRDANAAVGKYVDIFVREAIARTAVEKRGGFLEVEDLEKVAPQLLLDL